MKFLSGYENMLQWDDAMSASSPKNLYLYPTCSMHHQWERRLLDATCLSRDVSGDLCRKRCRAPTSALRVPV